MNSPASEIPHPLRQLWGPLRDEHLASLRALIAQLRSQHGPVVGECLIRVEQLEPFPSRRMDAVFKGSKGEPQFRDLKDHLPTDCPVGFSAEIQLRPDAEATRCRFAPFVWNSCPVQVELRDDDWASSLKPWFAKWLDPDDKRPADESGVAGVVHAIEGLTPREKAVSFIVDFGSAPVEAAYELMNSFILAGAVTISLGASVTEAASPSIRQPEAKDKARIVPLVRPLSSILSTKEKISPIAAKAEMSGKPVPEDQMPCMDTFVGDLSIRFAIDDPNTMTTLSPAMLKQLGWKREDLFTLGAQNLRKLYPEMTVVRNDGFAMVTKSGELESSWMLVRDFWAEQARSMKGEVVVAVPTRDSLIFVDSASRSNVDRLRIIVDNAHAQAGTRGISKLLYAFRAGHWEVFEQPAVELLLEEKVDEARLPGPKLSADSLTAFLRKLPPLKTPTRTLDWVKAEDAPDGSLSVIFRVIGWNDGSITDVVERDWKFIPAEARDEPQRVYNFLTAFTATAKTHAWLDAFWIASLDPLSRSGARQRATFERILVAHGRNLTP
jgi:uncharacterized protein YtpQ (UPF0354 family)